MRDRLFTVVIPTRNRADVLAAAIRTAIAQDDENLEILVSDNASTDGTRSTVTSFTDRRIRYVNPGNALGMPEHWEFALSHVAPGYVTVLGDDDGLLPDAVRRARSHLNTYGVPALAWRKAEYHWPDHIIPTLRNWLQIPFGDIRVLHSAGVLEDVLRFRRTYTDLPCIYNSFVSTDLLHELRKRSRGQLFPCVTPDVYSAIAIASITDRYLFSGNPLSINAASRYSNGTITSFRGINDGQAREHLTTTKATIHPRLVASSSVAILIADAALIAKENIVRSGAWPEIDWRRMFEIAAEDAQHRPPPVLAETIAALDEVARRNCMETMWKPLRDRLSQKELTELQPPGWDASGNHLAVDGAKLNLRDVSDASLFVAAALCWVNEGSLDSLSHKLAQRSEREWTQFLFSSKRPTATAVPSLRRYWRSICRRARSLL